MSQPKKILLYQYKFEFENGPEINFDVELNAQTLELINKDGTPKPEWTKLAYDQCENCPLSPAVEYCPVAVNLARIVETFRNDVSYESTLVTVKTPERTFVKKTTLQKGLSSIIGVFMATSNCPVMDILRPMARFHLPFATSIETFFRSISTYLTGQFIRAAKGLEPDWNLQKLLVHYKAINSVNKGMSSRLMNASKQDASVNAVVILHSFGDGISYFIQRELEDIEPLFSAYLDPQQQHDQAAEATDPLSPPPPP
jgi:hypothetical protein